jgi:trigger factor
VFRDALKQAEIAAIGQPSVDGGFEALLERFEPGKELSLTLEMDVEPTPSLKSTKGLKAEAESVSFDAARVDELIEQSRRQLATLVPVEKRAAQSGDVAVLAFSGVYADTDEAISGGSSEAMEVELEEGRMIPGFIEGVIGMKAGDTATVDCQFPESYPQEDAAGRKARFEITLKELKSRELPALDDAFAQQASDKQTLAELRRELETRRRDDADRRGTANRHNALIEALVEQLEVELPETLVQQEIRNLIEQTAGQIAEQGMDVKKLFTPDLVRSLMDTSRPEAEQRLKRSLALQALAKDQPEIQVTVLYGLNEALMPWVKQGEVDFALSSVPTRTTDPDLSHERLLTETATVVARAGHPLAQHKVVTPDLLTPYPWVLPRKRELERLAFDDYFVAQGLEPPTAQVETTSTVLMKSMVMQSDALTFIPAELIYWEVRAGQLLALQASGNQWARQVGITRRRKGSMSPASQRLLAAVKSVAKNF